VFKEKKVSTNSGPPSQSHLASLVGGFILAIEAKLMFKTTQQICTRYSNIYIYGWMDGYMDGWMDGWMYGCMDVGRYACMYA